VEHGKYDGSGAFREAVLLYGDRKTFLHFRAQRTIDLAASLHAPYTLQTIESVMGYFRIVGIIAK
jgi:hypothetical protein